MSNKTLFSYRVIGNYLLSRKQNELLVERYSKLHHLAYELQYMLHVAKRLRMQPFIKSFKRWYKLKKGESGILPAQGWYSSPIRAALKNLYTIAVRLLYYSLKPFAKKKIWLISDRIMGADDSGEILFRYIMEQHKQNDIRVYFTISKKSSEYQRISQYGPVVDFGSMKHKILFLLSDKVISSEATDAIINIFGWRLHDFVDLYKFDFVFLQHGIIRDDISRWLNKYNKNIKMFVTSAKPEHKSIIEGKYGYNDDVVKLTGLPRYDWFEDKPENKIILMPTWRDNLVGPVDFKSGLKAYNPDFINSEYYEFFNGLMNNEKLRTAMKERGYSGEFYIHPSFQNQTDDFKGNDEFTIMKMPHDYKNAKSTAKLMITDYSSVAFDLAYLHKPVIYAQFDAHSFYDVHTSQTGYFDYDRDGFGPVTYDIESTVTAAINYISSNCLMEKKFEKRTSDFFAFDDKSNAKRVYDEIISMRANS